MVYTRGGPGPPASIDRRHARNCGGPLLRVASTPLPFSRVLHPHCFRIRFRCLRSSNHSPSLFVDPLDKRRNIELAVPGGYYHLISSHIIPSTVLRWEKLKMTLPAYGINRCRFKKKKKLHSSAWVGWHLCSSPSFPSRDPVQVPKRPRCHHPRRAV